MEVEWDGDPKIIRLLNIMDDLGLQENQYASPEALVDLAENANRDFNALCSAIAALMNDIIPPELSTTLRFSFENENELKQLLTGLGFTEVQKINEYETKLAILDFLLCELQVYRMLAHQSLKEGSNPASETNVMETDQYIVSGKPLRELTDEDKIQRMCSTLNVPFSKNYSSTLHALTEKAQHIINETPELKSKNIWEHNLTPKHMQLLEEINTMLKQDYSSRKTVLLKRLDVTLQTFLWSEKAIRNKDEVDATLAEQKKEIAKLGESSINVFDIFAASSELTSIVKTSAKSVESKDALKKIVIGTVPDRGGRLEQKGQNSMPSFTTRSGAAHDKNNVVPAPQRHNRTTISDEFREIGTPMNGPTSERTRARQLRTMKQLRAIITIIITVEVAEASIKLELYQCHNTIMTEANILSVIAIVASRLKRSSDSLEVFRSVLNLSITSTASKNYLNDQLLVEMNYRYVKSRTLFIINKLNYFIRGSSFDDGFEPFADLVLNQFSILEGVRIIQNRLLYVTEHASSTFLSSYLRYIQNYRESLFQKNERAQLIYPKTRPKLFIKAMKYANNNRIEDKLLMLTTLIPETVALNYEIQVRQQQRLNFASISNWLSSVYRGTPIYTTIEHIMTALFGSDMDNFAVIVRKRFLDLPIEKQPWFFGSADRDQIEQIFSQVTTREYFLVAFSGSRLYCYRSSDSKRIYDEECKRRLPLYGIVNKKLDYVEKDMKLYEFYCQLVAQNLSYLVNYHVNGLRSTWRLVVEDESSIWIEHNQPHPLCEYLNVVDDIREDIVEWLFEHFPLTAKNLNDATSKLTYQRVNFEWERKYIPDSHMAAIQKIIERGGAISANLMIQYMTKVMPTRYNELKLLASAWDGIDRTSAFKFLLYKYRNLYKQRRVISETKMTVLLAWKHAEGESIGFRNLPKELVQSIVVYIDEIPMVRFFAQALITRRCKCLAVEPLKMTKQWLSDNLWALDFWAFDLPAGFKGLYDIPFKITKCPYAIFRKKKQVIYELVRKTDQCGTKFLNFVFKYETERRKLELMWRQLLPLPEREILAMVLEALKSRNMTSLTFLVRIKAVGMPSREEFDKTIKPKHQLSYEQALKLVANCKK